MARVKQPRRTGALHRPHQGGSADARPNPVGKKPAPFARVFSPADDVRILEGLADYVAKHGKQPDPSKLHDACAVDKAEYTGTQIYEKVRRLKDWYFAQAKRADGRGVRDDARNDATVTTKYELSTKIWGKKRRGERRGFEEMRCRFPNLSATVDKIASESNCGAVYTRAFELMDDEEAAGLEAKVKKQRIEAAKMIMSRTTLTNQVLDVLIKSRD